MSSKNIHNWLRTHRTLFLLGLVVLSIVLCVACVDDGDGVIEDLPRVGDAMKIGEKLEQTTCEATGGRWNDSTNTCHK